MTTVAVMQSSYMPWLGHFDLLKTADVYVIYDDVQYDKGSWRNRNRIRTETGWSWLTVPVKTSGRFGQPINMVETKGNSWAKNHVDKLHKSYRDTPYFTGYMPVLETLLKMDWPYLVNLNSAVFRLFQKWLDIDTPVVLSSQLHTSGKATERLINICQALGADHYYSAQAAKSYLDVDAMNESGIQVTWQDYKCREYPQAGHEQFISHLSAIDLIFNTGPNAKDWL